MVLSSDSGVLSTRSSSSASFLCMTSTASSVGTLVNSEVTQKLTRAYPPPHVLPSLHL